MYDYTASGAGTGDNRALEAAENAVYALFLQHEIAGMTAVVISIASGPDLVIDQVEQISNYIREATELPDEAVRYQLSLEPALQQEVHVTIHAEFG